MLTLGTLSLHLYGLFIGNGIWVSAVLCEKKATENGISEKIFWRIFGWSLIGGIIGARTYHILTDAHFYLQHPWNIFAIWNGGLSIIGGVVGGAVAAYFYLRFFANFSPNSAQKNSTKTFLKMADLLVFGLPFGQAIGRLGNFFNQELYGLPTNLPWKIYIDPAHRFPQYSNQPYYHPLFAYEMIGTFSLGILMWFLAKKNIWEIGSGNYALFYIFSYCLLRFFLDFLRIDKATFTNGWGVNQLVLVGVMFAILFYHLAKSSKKTLRILPIFLTFSAIFCSTIFLTGCQFFSQNSPASSAASFSPIPQIDLAHIPDRQKITLHINGHDITVEVVNTPASMTLGLGQRSQLGEDGMLFAFGQVMMPQFWMKDMQFDLDFVWLRDLKITEITPDVKHPDLGTPDSALPIYSPKEPGNMVLEIDAGRAQELNLQPRQTFQISAK